MGFNICLTSATVGFCFSTLRTFTVLFMGLTKTACLCLHPQWKLFRQSIEELNKPAVAPSSALSVADNLNLCFKSENIISTKKTKWINIVKRKTLEDVCEGD